MAQSPLSYSRDGQGPHLLLVHGGVGSRSHWLRNIPELARHFTVTAVDLPGFGESADVPRDIAPNAYLDLVADTVRALGLARLRVAAFSFGAVVSAALAVRMPDAIACLALVAPGGFGFPSGRQLDLRSVPREELGSPQHRDALRHNLGITMFTDPATADAATVELHRSNVERARFDSRRVSLTDRIVDDLARTRCPLQLIWGEQDAMAYPSIEDRFRQIKAVRSDARLDLIPGAGHWAQYERPAATNEALLDFMLLAGGAKRAIGHEN